MKISVNVPRGGGFSPLRAGVISSDMVVAGVLFILSLQSVQAGVSDPGSAQTCVPCDRIDVCYGGDSGRRSEDALCITTHDCNMAIRADACNLCFPDVTAEASDYMDCDGTCYDVEDAASMVQVDACGVCGGDSNTCNPKVSTVQPPILPSGHAARLGLIGRGFKTEDLQIVVLSSENPDNPRRVVQVAVNERSPDGYNIAVNINELTKGGYEIGARTGRTGEDYTAYEIPVLIVYMTADFEVDSITPSNYDIVGTDARLPVTLHIKTREDMGAFVEDMRCIIGPDTTGPVGSGTTEPVAPSVTESGTFSVADGTLACELDKPAASTGLKVCVTFNGVHEIGCGTLAFYAPAPTVLEENAIKFSPKADQMRVTFNVAVRHLDYRSTRNCSYFFYDVTELGRGAECTWSQGDTVLTATIGEGASVGPNSKLILKPGLRDATAPYSRVTDAIPLRTVTDGVLPVVIVPLSGWPVTLTTYAANPLTLGVKIEYAPGGRAPVSIQWFINGDVQFDFLSSYTFTIDVTEVTQYNVSVLVIDAFGGQAQVWHTITKVESLSPDVRFRPVSGLRIRPDSSLETHPNTPFVIGTQVEFVGTAYSSLDNYTFQWYKNDKAAGKGFFYRASRTEISTDLCGSSVVFKLQVSQINDPWHPPRITETSVTVNIVCREPVVRIAGSSSVDVPMDVALRVNIDGQTHTFDPDGGTLAYEWECKVQIYSNIRNCITYFRLEDQATTPWLRFSNSKFKGSDNNEHVFKLTVTAVKNGVNYTASATVKYIPRDTPVPWVRWVTLQHEYRSNVPIVVRAYVGLKVEVEWSFVAGETEYDYADLADREVYQEKKIVEGFAWLTIKPYKLTPGQRYLLELKVTNTSAGSAATTSTFELYVYRKLRLCTLHVNPLVELEEAKLTVQACASDDHVHELETTCRLEGREITMDGELTFTVPRFAERGITEVQMNCTIMDDVGHVLHVQSEAIAITLQGDVDKALQDKMTELKKEGKLVELVKLMSDNIEGSTTQQNAQQTRVVEEIRTILGSKPTPREITRTLKSVNNLNVKDIEKPEVMSSLASHMLSMLSSLCGEPISSRAEDLTKEDIMGLISRARELAKKVRSTSKVYRHIQEKIACIKIKGLAVETQDEIAISDDSDGDGGDSAWDDATQGDGTGEHGRARARYLVGSLDDVRAKGLLMDFPKELKEKYRDQHACKGNEMCDGVGLVVEEHRGVEPPDIQRGRRDKECMTYTFVDLYNPRTGAKIVVNELREKIGIEFETHCPRAECFYWEQAVNTFSQSGVTTGTRMREVEVEETAGEGGDIGGTGTGDGETGAQKSHVMTVMCETSHLSCFTLHSEHVGDDSLNIVMVVGLTLGILLLIVSTVILIRAYVIARRKKSAKEKGDYSVEYERQ